VSAKVVAIRKALAANAANMVGVRSVDVAVLLN